MSIKNYCIISIISIVGGIIFYGFYDEKIHIDYSIKHSLSSPSSTTWEPLTLFYVKNDSVTSFTHTYKYDHTTDDSIKNIINIWLSYFYEYDSTLCKTQCHSLINRNNIYYCSFTTNPFYPTTSLYSKHVFFEGLLKTLTHHNSSCKGIIFLINHGPFEDCDYDFSLPWNISIFN